MTTGIKLVYGSVGYMILIFIIFAYMPNDSFVFTNAELDDVSYEYDPTLDQTATDNIDVFDVFSGLFTFGLSGADVPWWLSILAVYLPLFTLGLGTYGLIRGI